jgi:hypothetical protein
MYTLHCCYKDISMEIGQQTSKHRPKCERNKKKTKTSKRERERESQNGNIKSERQNSNTQVLDKLIEIN